MTEQEIWQYKEELSRRMRHALVDLNNLIIDSAQHGMKTHVRILPVDMSDLNTPVRDHPVSVIDCTLFEPSPQFTQ
jgi:hypothetical protein